VIERYFNIQKFRDSMANSDRTFSGPWWREMCRVNHVLCPRLTFISPCIANIFAAYNQQDATFHNLFNSVRRCTFFRRFFHLSPGAQNCTYVRYLLDQYCYLLRAKGSSIGLTNTWRCMCSFELLMMDGKTFWNVLVINQLNALSAQVNPIFPLLLLFRAHHILYASR